MDELLWRDFYAYVLYHVPYSAWEDLRPEFTGLDWENDPAGLAAASTGTDPQPYFRVFNPVSQAERFDPTGAYVRRWVPELAGVGRAKLHAPWTMTPAEQAAAGAVIGRDHAAPIVDHVEARRRALARFEAATAGPAAGRGSR